MNRFYINPSAILFIPQKDALNDYETIACDWEREEFIKINAHAYKILEAIKDNSGLILDELSNILRKDEIKLNRFLEDMVAKNIVFKK